MLASLPELYRDWLSYLSHRQSDQTVQIYGHWVGRFISHIQSIHQKPPTTSEIEKYITQSLIHRKNSTVNVQIAAIKSFYRWIESLNLGIENAARSIKALKTTPSESRFITSDEYEQILLVTKNRPNLHSAIQFLGNTGLRETEFRSLTWACFNADSTFVRIIGKGRKKRHVPLNDTCRQLLADKSNSHRPDFVQPFLRAGNFWSACQAIAQRARIEPFGSHALRHFFATRLIKAGVPLSIVSRILGHSSTAITERVYVHLLIDDLQVTDCLEF